MKKLLLIFALVAVFGVVVSSASVNMNPVNNSEISIEDEKEDKKKEKEIKASENETSSATVEPGCSETQIKSCAASGKSCCGGAEEKE